MNKVYCSVAILLGTSLVSAQIKRDTCEPPPNSYSPGPAFLPNAPELEAGGRLCPISNRTSYMQTDTESCFGPLCFRRQRINVTDQYKSVDFNNDDVNIVLQGVVKQAKTCAPITDVHLDLWQADSEGWYGNIDPSHPDSNYCRGQMKSNAVGRFTIRTQMPGASGLNGVLNAKHADDKYNYDMLPYGPRVIQGIAWKEGYKPLVFNFYFEKDDSIYYDYRPYLVDRQEEQDFAVHNRRLLVKFRRNYVNEGHRATVDLHITMVPLTEKESEDYKGLSRLEVYKKHFCQSGTFNWMKAPMLCSDQAPIYFKIMTYLMYAAPVLALLTIFGTIQFFKWCLFSGLHFDDADVDAAEKPKEKKE